jgi:hypothetical protein
MTELLNDYGSGFAIVVSLGALFVSLITLRLARRDRQQERQEMLDIVLREGRLGLLDVLEENALLELEIGVLEAKITDSELKKSLLPYHESMENIRAKAAEAKSKLDEVNTADIELSIRLRQAYAIKAGIDGFRKQAAGAAEKIRRFQELVSVQSRS